MLRIAFCVVLLAHALLHTLGFLKGFGVASLDQLKLPISRSMGLLWLASTLLLFASLVLLLWAPRWFWLVAAVGLVASQVAITSSWADARFGTIPNVLLFVVAAYGAFAWGPFGLRAEYERLVAEGIAQSVGAAPPANITEADLARLPPLVQRYVRFAGVVGTPRAAGFRARMKGRIRGSATAAWMPFVAEQHNFYDPPRRYFFMQATRGGLPVDGLHVYGQAGASMRIRLASLLPIVDLGGADLMRTETVTILNEVCIFAPSRLLDPAITWRELDARSVEATYTNGPYSIRAVLVFDDAGALVDFWSDDRPALSEDGKTLLSQRWSTPLREYRAMGPFRLASRGEGRYAPASGDYAYLEIEIQEVRTDLSPRGTP